MSAPAVGVGNLPAPRRLVKRSGRLEPHAGNVRVAMRGIRSPRGGDAARACDYDFPSKCCSGAGRPQPRRGGVRGAAYCLGGASGCSLADKHVTQVERALRKTEKGLSAEDHLRGINGASFAPQRRSPLDGSLNLARQSPIPGATPPWWMGDRVSLR